MGNIEMIKKEIGLIEIKYKKNSPLGLIMIVVFFFLFLVSFAFGGNWLFYISLFGMYFSLLILICYEQIGLLTIYIGDKLIYDANKVIFFDKKPLVKYEQGWFAYSLIFIVDGTEFEVAKHLKKSVAEDLHYRFTNEKD